MALVLAATLCAGRLETCGGSRFGSRLCPWQVKQGTRCPSLWRGQVALAPPFPRLSGRIRQLARGSSSVLPSGAAAAHPTDRGGPPLPDRRQDGGKRGIGLAPCMHEAWTAPRVRWAHKGAALCTRSPTTLTPSCYRWPCAGVQGEDERTQFELDEGMRKLKGAWRARQRCCSHPLLLPTSRPQCGGCHTARHRRPGGALHCSRLVRGHGRHLLLSLCARRGSRPCWSLAHRVVSWWCPLLLRGGDDARSVVRSLVRACSG